MESKQHDPLLRLTFELNPLTPKEEVKVDQRILLDVLPVQVVYDAVSLATSSPVVPPCRHCAVIVLSLCCRCHVAVVVVVLLFVVLCHGKEIKDCESMWYHDYCRLLLLRYYN